MVYNELTEEEKLVIENKGTEAPFTGEYDNFFEVGVYICRRCNALLYDSKAKFNAPCGWPSFDAEYPKAVKKNPDTDGVRTEILCANCGAHLGHVFTGEKLTAKNTRHCVNSLSMRFIPRKFKEGDKCSVVLGGGCFWCLEAVYLELRGVEGVISGYAGGHKENPTYEEVCDGTTWHAEVIEITYNPEVISYKQILGVFFSTHNPTTLNCQGNDIGEQYRSLILYKTLEQKEEAEEIIRELEKEKAFNAPIVTEIKPLLKFYPAEESHQGYYKNHPEQAYCRAIILPKVTKLRKKHRGIVRKSVE